MTDFAKTLLPIRLRQLRLRAKLHQKDLADQIGMSRGTYANYENGSREPDPATLVFIASRLGVSIDYLTGNSDFELPVESGVKYGILRQLRLIQEEDLQPYTPRLEQPPYVADSDNGPGYPSGS
ncbi:MAG: XRE family transcriptional regulator [Clostridia bacterium]|nr:XRE family transcriptional regulator [Clostridia bacterium]NCC75394.1 XRE family transcriptional regulator [Clostridia bacterium]